MPRPYTRYPCGIYGPRNLVRRHARRVKARRFAAARGTDVVDPPIPLPGQEQLFSFWTPSLEAGEYTITVTQNLSSPSTNEQHSLPEQGSVAATQTFDVVAPRFALPDDAIHSSFPPQGYGALAKTLPHVVLSDPHLPWARKVSTEPASTDPEYQRNMVPWLALVVFTQDELQLSAQQLSTLFMDTSLGAAAQQTQTLTVNVPVAEVPKIKSTISPIAGLSSEPSDTNSTDLVLMPPTLFSELFTAYDINGQPLQAQAGPDVSRYKYLAHLRDINTAGMADAGVEDNGVFGVVISHRTGPLSNQQPQPVVAHLVSIEGVESDFWKANWPIGDRYQYVAMSSLYSWSFVTLPEGSFDIESTFVSLGTAPNGLGLLRAPDSVRNGINISLPMGSRLKSRLDDGYTLTQYRTATGEETAAMYRGPLTPTRVPYPLSLALQQKTKLKSCWLSDSGIDCQIMDPLVGIMDITYSVAWQLGKTLAVADQLFTTALGRLRTAIYSGAMNSATASILQQHGVYATRDEAVTNLSNAIQKLNSLHKSNPGLCAPGGSLADRWQRPQPSRPDLSYHGSPVQEIFDEHARTVAGQLMLSSDGDGLQLYDELNSASSVDWMVVLKWVLDKMFLYSIPAHYLITEPSHLPPESLRFFHVDRNWTDALIDGALSLGNHLSGTDKVRFAIHQMIEDYLYPSSESLLEVVAAPAPQIPLYGFLMRSDAVTQYPDLKVTVTLSGASQPADEINPILRHENLDVILGVMLCILDRPPGNPGLESITFTEPPHQQSFIAGAQLNSQQITTLYKQIFTAPGQDPNPKSWASFTWNRPQTTDSDSSQVLATAAEIPGSTSHQDQDGVPPTHAQSVFKWGRQSEPDVRTLLPISWAADVNTILNYYGADNDKYVDNTPNAAMAGIQLNNPIYRLVIATPSSPPPTTREEKSVSFISSSKEVEVPFPPTLESGSRGPVLGPLKSQQSQTLPKETKDSLPLALNVLQPIGLPPRVGSGFALGSSHGYPTQVPPHHQRVVMFAEDPISTSSTKDSGPITPPVFSFGVLPLDNDPKKAGIPCGTGIPKDLVFSVSKTDSGTVSDVNDLPFLLEEMRIQLQVATKEEEVSYCLLDGSNYNGPGPFMTSNVRFFVQAQLVPPAAGDTNTYLALRILPRSSKGYAGPEMYEDMTFVLPSCVIAAVDVTKHIPMYTIAQYSGRAPVPSTEYYAIQLAQWVMV